MPSPLPAHPLKKLYDKSALELALHSFEALPIVQTDEVAAWIGAAAEGIDEKDLREPTINTPLFEGYIVTLLRLAGSRDDLDHYAPDWTPTETEDIAALLVSASLTRRARAATPTPAATSDDGAEAATRRGWRVPRGRYWRAQGLRVRVRGARGSGVEQPTSAARPMA